MKIFDFQEAIKRDDLMEYFLRFGEIQTLRLNSQRFFGSITYIQAESVAKACKNRNHKVNGYVIDVTKASYWNITRVFDQKLENDDGRVPLGWNSSDAVEMEFTEVSFFKMIFQVFYVLRRGHSNRWSCIFYFQVSYSELKFFSGAT